MSMGLVSMCEDCQQKELMEQLNNWNVDGIFTNFPDRAKELGLEK